MLNFGLVSCQVAQGESFEGLEDLLARCCWSNALAVLSQHIRCHWALRISMLEA